MAKLYWNTDRTQHTSSENVRALYEKFVSEVIGLEYSELSDKAREIYNKTSDYFTQLTTPLNFLGFLQTVEDENGHRIVSKNEFLDKNILNHTFSKLYLDYYLSYWQYPRHNNSDDRDLAKRKPYLIILQLLKMLSDRNHEEAYLTKKEFFHLFDNDSPPYKSYTDINEALVTEILDNDRSWGRGQDDVSDGDISYDKALLNNSSLLTFNGENYGSPDGFYVGLSGKENTLKKLEWLLSDHMKNDTFNFDPSISYRDKDVINDWAKFITDVERFNKWFTAMSIYDFKDYAGKNGFNFQDDLIRRFILSIATKPFLILTGISGSGKTKIAELYGEYLRQNSRGEHYVLAIGSNWNDNKKLLGFKNPLQANPDEAYQKTLLVEFMQEANENLDKQYIVILDEMNLSYTEKYFADFLSALESRDHKIILPNGEIMEWTKNIKIIGTVNEDETTHTISPKVLDRANVIEMNGVQPSEYISSQIIESIDLYTELESNIDIEKYKALLDEIYECLNGNFAFRVVDEISIYINQNKIYDSSKELDELLDEQIYQKILPKIHGSKLDLPKKLNKLKEVLEATQKPYSNTNSKIEKMLSHVSTHGYASFITG